MWYNPKTDITHRLYMCLLSVVKAGAKSLSGCKFIMVWYFTRMFGSFNLIRRITNLAKKEFAANILATGVGRWNCCSHSHIKRRLNSNSNLSEQATTSSTETIWFKQSIYACHGFCFRLTARCSTVFAWEWGQLLRSVFRLVEVTCPLLNPIQ